MPCEVSALGRSRILESRHLIEGAYELGDRAA